MRRLAGLALAPLATGCGREEPLLRFASHVWPGYELLRLARDEGWLPAGGLVLEDTPTSKESLQGLADGRIAAAGLTLDEMLRGRAGGIPLTAVLVFDVSAGADVLMASPEIASLGELAGKRVLAEDTPLARFMLHHVLHASRLPAEAVKVLYARSDNHLNLWQSGSFDAIVTYEPYATSLEELGAHRLFDTRQMPDAIIDVLAVRRDALDRHGDALRQLIHAHFRALTHLRQNPQDAAFRMARRLGLTGQEVLRIFGGLALPDLASNRRFLDGALAEAAAQVSATMVRAGMLQTADRLARLVTADLLPRED